MLACSRERICNNLIRNNEEVMTKLEAQKFDLAVVDANFVTKCFYLVPHRLRVPWATYTHLPDPTVMRAPWLPSFVPHSVLPLTDRMGFVDRLRNTVTLAVSSVYSPFRDPPSHLLDEYRRYGWFRDLGDLMARSQLWLLTKDVVLEHPRPMMPNMVDVGGLTVGRTSGGLPADVRRFVEGAERGAILVTFGSSLSTLPETFVEKFASAFRRLDGYRVVWRLNNRDDVELSRNVMISRWLPQNNLLSHPSVKLFITHCGINGQFEAVYHAVPMIGFPISPVNDQDRNARLLADKGYGLSMNMHEFTADQLVDNVHKIMEDGSYKQRVTKASQIFRGQAQSPVERAAFWIEHVCRFGGAHLRSAGNDLPLYSYLMLDVLAVVVGAFLFAVCLLAKLVSLVNTACENKRTALRKRLKYD